MSSIPMDLENRNDGQGDLIGIGAGGHARVMIELAQQCGYRMVCLLEPESSSCDQRMLDHVKIERVDEEMYFRKLVRASRSCGDCSAVSPSPPAAVLCIGTARDTDRRTTVFERLEAIGYTTPALVAPSAILENHVQIGRGVHVLSGALIAAGASLGHNVLVNHRVIVEHDCRIGNHVHLASGSILCGGVVVGDRALIGAGSVVLPGIDVGAGAIIGAGATVTKDVPPGKTYIGNPARQLERKRVAA